MDINELLQKGEGSTLEFKENMKSEGIIPTLIAFANTSGGRLVIGVNDKTHHISGIENPHKGIEALASQIHDSIEPRIMPNIEVVPFRNTHLIIVEIYPSALRPHYKKSDGKEGSTYIRIGSSTRRADKDLLKVVERSTSPKSFDEELFYEINCEEIDFTLASQLFSPQRKLQQSDFVSLGVLEKKGKELIPTVGGVILFGKDRLHYFPDACIHAAVFKETEFLDKQKITSIFPQAIDEVLAFIRRNMRVGLKIEDVRNQEVWEVPKVALREAIINAIVHTDYSLRGAPIKVSMFEDRVEIENSALLPWGLTFEDLKAGVSKLRNPVIARVFNELGLIEQWGSGIRRMTKACVESGLEEPEFREIGPRIRVTFYKEKISQAVLNDTDNFIMDLLGFCGPLSSHQITSCVNLTKRSVINRLSKLVDKGQIRELAQSLNDPKKKYDLLKSVDKMTLIENAFWDRQNVRTIEDILGRLYVRIQLGQDYINFIFDRNTIDDFFLDHGDRPELKDQAIEKVKSVIVSDPIFAEVLLKALADEKVQESFQKREFANYLVKAEDFLERDYR
jgi:ATP-dependent DNA helicase RecG